MTIKEIFEKAETEGKTLTFEQFEKIAKETKAKFTDLSEGLYVSKDKYENELKAKDDSIKTLNDTISQRDKDIEDVKKQLTEAGEDAGKLGEVSKQLEDLQTKYDADMKSYQDQLSKQSYSFAVKEFAAQQKFSSNAAKHYFEQSMIEANLKMNKKGEITGADDFLKDYKEENADSFVVEETPQESEQNQLNNQNANNNQGNGQPYIPQFTAPTQGQTTVGTQQPSFGFSFSRPMPTN